MAAVRTPPTRTAIVLDRTFHYSDSVSAVTLFANPIDRMPVVPAGSDAGAARPTWRAGDGQAGGTGDDRSSPPAAPELTSGAGEFEFATGPSTQPTCEFVERDGFAPEVGWGTTTTRPQRTRAVWPGGGRGRPGWRAYRRYHRRRRRSPPPQEISTVNAPSKRQLGVKPRWTGWAKVTWRPSSTRTSSAASCHCR